MSKPKKAVSEIQPYKPPLEGRRGKIRLDFNERTTGFLSDGDTEADSWLTAYPEYSDLLQQLSTTWELPTDRFMLTNGSDEALFVIAFTFIEPNTDTAVTSSPTYSLIPHYLQLVQSQLVEIPVTDDLTFDRPAIEQALTQEPKLAMFASPENPTGDCLSVEAVEHWCQQFPETLFVIDEAYSEYTGTSVIPLIDHHPNLLVTKTFSKAWGLAGLRLGMIIGQPHLMDALQRVRSPYSVNSLAVKHAITLLTKKAEVLAAAKDTMTRKIDVIGALKDRGFRVIPGKANFFLLFIGIAASEFAAFCSEQGVLVRDRSSFPKLWGMVRVSMGTPEEMNTFLQCVDAYRNSRTIMFDLDGTLVDTSQSFDVTVQHMVERYSGKPLDLKELLALRAEGGFNDDWDSTVELLHRRGIEVSYAEIQEKAGGYYLSIAKDTEHLMIEEAELKILQKKHPLSIATGRYRPEYAPVWQDRLSPYFSHCTCMDDDPNAQGKPAPDILQHSLQALNVSKGYYIGNSVDDMRAAIAAGLIPIGITTTHPADVLKQAGAHHTIDSLNQLGGLL